MEALGKKKCSKTASSQKTAGDEIPICLAISDR